jgi:hypothetical protein
VVVVVCVCARARQTRCAIESGGGWVQHGDGTQAMHTCAGSKASLRSAAIATIASTVSRTHFSSHPVCTTQDCLPLLSAFGRPRHLPPYLLPA